MFKLFASKKLNKIEPSTSKQFDRTKKKTKNKGQASKKQVHEAVEFIWLKQLLNRKIVTGILLLTAIIGASFLLPKEGFLPIAKIKVSGDFNQLDLAKINSQLKAYMGKGFFSVDIKYIQKNLSLEPWIETVSVSRIWPNQIHVYLNEKQAVARWDNDHLLSNKAIIFKVVSNKFSHLPLINGYSGQSVELLQRYSGLQQDFSKRGIYLAAMTEDSKGALSLLLDKKLKVNIGSENNELKIKHLLAVYPQQIKPRIEHIEHIDFRYSNGFAIAWTDEYLNMKKSGDSKKRGNKNV